MSALIEARLLTRLSLTHDVVLRALPAFTLVS